VSVSSVITLPAQPVSGLVEQQSLSGNGYSAPHSETHIRINLAADASGGIATLEFLWDQRWASILSWVNLTVNGLGLDVGVLYRYAITGNVSLGVTKTLVANGVGAIDDVSDWIPPPQIASVPAVGQTQPSLRVVTQNLDGDTYQLDACLMNYKKDVLQVVPLARLYAPFPRG